MATTPQPKRQLRLFTVTAAHHLTPHMIRITLASDDIRAMQTGCEGANCKIFLPELGQSRDNFAEQLENGPRPTVRTYTVRHIRPDMGEMDIDFVDHGDVGPASAWARQASAGAFCGFAGPGPVKVASFYADHYLVVADMSAIPVAAATLEAMPADAVGHAIFEITSSQDRQIINTPEGIKQDWIINPHPNTPNTIISDAVKALDLPKENVQMCIAGESSMIKTLRQELLVTRKYPKDDVYISGYWKIGLIEDEHQAQKRAETAR